MTRQRNHSIAKAAIALALAAAASGLLAATALAGASSTVSHSAAGSAAKVRQIKRYWTPQRMRSATPRNVKASPAEISRT